MTYLEQLKIIWRELLDFLLPPSPTLRQLKTMTADELRRRAPAPRNAADTGSIALLDYRHPLIKAGVWAVKFRGDRKVAALFAEILWEALSAEEEDRALFETKEKPVITIMPLSKKRFRERGFNQCELLIDCFPPSAAADSFFEIQRNLLTKVRETAPQTELSRAKRLKNLHGAFEVALPEEVRGRRMIVIDDVTTTGATFAEARRALLAAGAKSVSCLAIAH